MQRIALKLYMWRGKHGQNKLRMIWTTWNNSIDSFLHDTAIRGLQSDLTSSFCNPGDVPLRKHCQNSPPIAVDKSCRWLNMNARILSRTREFLAGPVMARAGTPSFVWYRYLLVCYFTSFDLSTVRQSGYKPQLTTVFLKEKLKQPTNNSWFAHIQAVIIIKFRWETSELWKIVMASFPTIMAPHHHVNHHHVDHHHHHHHHSIHIIIK